MTAWDVLIRRDAAPAHSALRDRVARSRISLRVPTPSSTPRAVLGQNWSQMSMESIGEALLASSHGLAEDLAEELAEELEVAEIAVDTGGL